jgi:dTDP-glucose pyrophosphorylase
MAGSGSRFINAGYSVPKPLLDLDGKSMVQRVFENLYSKDVERVIFIRNNSTSFNLKKLQKNYPQVEILEKAIDYITDGPARTVSLIENMVDPEQPLLIANSDQLVAYSIPSDYSLLNKGYDGIVWCMEDNDPKWSYVEIENESLVTRVVEKEVISNLATVGIYAFGKSKYFFESFNTMVRKLDKVNNEYYVAPSYNYLLNHKRILAKNLGQISDVVFGLGIPEDYEMFLKNSNRSQIYEISSAAIPKKL